MLVTTFNFKRWKILALCERFVIYYLLIIKLAEVGK